MPKTEKSRLKSTMSTIRHGFSSQASHDGVDDKKVRALAEKFASGSSEENAAEVSREAAEAHFLLNAIRHREK